MKFIAEHLGLPARLPAALKDWYVHVLGAKVVFENHLSPPAYLLALPGGLMVEIHEGRASVPETGDNSVTGWRHLALRVDSIEAAKTALEKSGVNFPDPIKPAAGGGRVVFFRDLEENLLHLVERPAESAFRPLA
jgi:glyoxylase I family protein